jgi:hypothetical protein
MSRVIYTGTGGEYLTGFAKKKLKQLQKARALQRLPAKVRKMYVDGIFIELRACHNSVRDLIKIGGASVGSLLLGVGGKLYIHDYSADATTKALTISEAVVATGDLHTSFNKAALVRGDYRVSGKSSKWSSSALDLGDDYLGLVNEYELSLYASDAAVYGLIDKTTGLVSNIPTDLILPEYCGPYGSMFRVAGQSSDDQWNAFVSPDFFSLIPKTGEANHVASWVPNFFTVEPDDAYSLPPGWYYGVYPFSSYGIDSALTSLKVSFCGVMESRSGSDEYDHGGWCEVVTDWENDEGSGSSIGDVYFYTDAMTTSGSDYTYYERVSGYLSEGYLTIGSSLTGTAHAFKVEFGRKPDSVHWWDCEYYAGQAQGAVIVAGTKAGLYRYTGGQATILEVEDYIDHAVSSDGQKVAIMCGDAVIERVYVYDLYGTKEDGEYINGAYTTLADGTTSMAGFEVVAGAFILSRASGFERTEMTLPIDPADADEADRSTFNSLGTLRFSSTGNGGITIWKVTCSDGINAEYSKYFNECFEGSRVVVDDPDTTTSTEHLVSKWDYGSDESTIKGIVRGTFGVDGQSFIGEGSGSVDSRYGPDNDGIVAAPSTFTLAYDDDTDTFSVSDYSGTVELGNGLTYNDDGDIVSSGSATCSDGAVIYTASTSCGQTAELEILFDELEISGADALSSTTDYETYSAIGGLAPYEWSFDSGTIDDDGKLTSISDCSTAGALATAVVTVKDSCGSEASIEVRLPGGTWVQAEVWTNSGISDDGFDYCTNGATIKAYDDCDDLAENTNYNLVTEIIGGYKYIAYYACQGNNSMNCDFPEDMYVPSPTCGSLGEKCYYNTYWDEPWAGTIVLSSAYVYEWQCDE